MADDRGSLATSSIFPARKSRRSAAGKCRTGGEELESRIGRSWIFRLDSKKIGFVVIYRSGSWWRCFLFAWSATTPGDFVAERVTRRVRRVAHKIIGSLHGYQTHFAWPVALRVRGRGSNIGGTRGVGKAKAGEWESKANDGGKREEEKQWRWCVEVGWWRWGEGWWSGKIGEEVTSVDGGGKLVADWLGWVEREIWVGLDEVRGRWMSIMSKISEVL